MSDFSLPLQDSLDALRTQLTVADPEALALRAGAIFTPKGESGGNFRLLYWSREVILHFPAFTGKYAADGAPLGEFDTALLAHYLAATDGTPMTERWIPFEQLPESGELAADFQARTGEALAAAFGNNADAFIAANEALYGRREFFGNLAFSYQVLPRVPLLVVGWLGGEEIPPAYRILFDASAPHHLPPDAYALLGQHLTQRLIQSAGA